MNEALSKNSIEAVAEQGAIGLVRDLRTAAALVRDGDWRRVAQLYDCHAWSPLAALGSAARDALFSFPPHQIGPATVAGLSDPGDRHVVVDLLAMFGCPP